MAVSWKLSLLSYRINYVGSMLLGIVLAVWFTVFGHHIFCITLCIFFWSVPFKLSYDDCSVIAISRVKTRVMIAGVLSADWPHTV